MPRKRRKKLKKLKKWSQDFGGAHQLWCKRQMMYAAVCLSQRLPLMPAQTLATKLSTSDNKQKHAGQFLFVQSGSTDQQKAVADLGLKSAASPARGTLEARRRRRQESAKQQAPGAGHARFSIGLPGMVESTRGGAGVIEGVVWFSHEHAVTGTAAVKKWTEISDYWNNDAGLYMQVLMPPGSYEGFVIAMDAATGGQFQWVTSESAAFHQTLQGKAASTSGSIFGGTGATESTDVFNLTASTIQSTESGVGGMAGGLNRTGRSVSFADEAADETQADELGQPGTLRAKAGGGGHTSAQPRKPAGGGQGGAPSGMPSSSATPQASSSAASDFSSIMSSHELGHPKPHEAVVVVVRPGRAGHRRLNRGTQDQIEYQKHVQWTKLVANREYLAAAKNGNLTLVRRLVEHGVMIDLKKAKFRQVAESNERAVEARRAKQQAMGSGKVETNEERADRLLPVSRNFGGVDWLYELIYDPQKSYVSADPIQSTCCPHTPPPLSLSIQPTLR